MKQLSLIFLCGCLAFTGCGSGSVDGFPSQTPGTVPTLVFAPIAAHTYGDAPFAVSASSSSAGAVSYAVVSGPAKVSNNMVTIVGAGAVVLSATQAATTTFGAATAQAAFTVAKANGVFTFGAISTHSFGDAPFTVLANSASTGAVSYAVSSGPATIAGNTVSLTGAGTVVLSATQADDANFNPAATQTSFQALPENGTLNFAAIGSHTYDDAPFTVSASSNAASTGAVSYSVVSGPATIAGNLVTITGAGAVTLNAVMAADPNFSQENAQVAFTVAKAVTPLTFAPIAAPTFGDPPFTVSASSISTGAITYTVVSGPATISGNTVTLTAGGTLTLGAAQASDANYRSATAQVVLHVTDSTHSLRFHAIAAPTFGDPPFAVSAVSASPEPISYSVVSGPATISGNVVTLTGAGTVVLEADQPADASFPAQTTQSSLVVAKGVAALAFDPIAPVIYGDPPFTVSASSDSTGNVTYSVVSGPATLSGNTVTLTGTGPVTLGARQSSDSNYAVATTQTTFTAAVPNTSAVGLVQHVVVIFQENVSFDHYFATYPIAANPAGEPVFNALPNTPPVDGLSGTLMTRNPNASNARNGAGAANPFRLDRSNAATADQDHGYFAEQMAFDNGSMDLFPLSVGTADGPSGPPGPAVTNGLTMGYFDGNTVTALWNYAQYFAMSDHFFGTTFGPSTPGAINLISGQTNGVTNDANSGGYIVADGSGGGSLIGDPDPTNDICSGSSLVHMTGKNVGDLLTASGVSWGFFSEGFDTTIANPNGTSGCGRSHTSTITGRTTDDYIPHHEPFQYYPSTANPKHARPAAIATIGQNGDGANHQYDTHDFFDAIKAGDFPAVSFLKSAAYRDGHAGYSDPLDEQGFVVSVLNAVQQTAQWPNTVVIIAYDDSDGWYDHELNVINGSASSSDSFSAGGKCGDGTTALPGVAPGTLHAQGRCGHGPRLPLIAVSPWAKPNYVDSTVTDQTSILRFVEDTFLNEERIGQGSYDSLAGPLNPLFDFRRSTPQNLRVVLLDGSTGTVTSIQ